MRYGVALMIGGTGGCLWLPAPWPWLAWIAVVIGMVITFDRTPRPP